MPRDGDAPRRDLAARAGRALGTRSLPAAAPAFEWADASDWLRAATGRIGEDILAELERRVAPAAPNATVVARGREGLRALLEVCARRPAGEVVIPAYTDVSVWETVSAAGYRPVLADVRASDANVAPQDVERVLSGRTAAVVVGHSFGHPADVDGIVGVAGEIPVVEDAAHALGARLRGRCVGGISRGAFTSFAPFKVIQAHGGGLVWSTDADVARALRAKVGAGPPFPRVTGPSKLLSHAALHLATTTVLHDLVTQPLTRLAAESRLDAKALYKKLVRPWLKRGADRGAPFTLYQAALASRQVDGLEARRTARARIADGVRRAVDDLAFVVRPGPHCESAELALVAYAEEPRATVRALSRHGVGALRSTMMDLRGVDGSAGAGSTSTWLDRHAVVLPLHDWFDAGHCERLITAMRDSACAWIPPDAVAELDRR